jgi:hypothetical protein
MKSCVAHLKRRVHLPNTKISNMKILNTNTDAQRESVHEVFDNFSWEGPRGYEHFFGGDTPTWVLSFLNTLKGGSTFITPNPFLCVHL